MIISDSLASDGGSEGFNGSGGGGGGFGSSGQHSSVFSLSLIEPNSNVSLPMFSEMIVGDNVVMLYHHKINLININKMQNN